MNWKIAVLLLMVMQLAVETLTKKATNSLPQNKTVGVAYQFGFCACLAALFAVARGDFFQDRMFFAVVGIGFLNGINNYFLWKAYAVSLSKTAVVLPLDGIWAIVLASVFLGEGALWNIQTLLGILLIFAAMWLFRSQRQAGDSVNVRWFWYTTALIVISGTTVFFMKAFSLDQVPLSTFLLGWYGGSFLGALILAMGGGIMKKLVMLPFRTMALITVLSLALVTALSLLYWSFSLGGPVIRVAPLRGLGSMLLPALIGWFYFKERQRLTRHEVLAFACGITGAVLILLR
jgi:hypothetical protein